MNAYYAGRVEGCIARAWRQGYRGAGRQGPVARRRTAVNGGSAPVGGPAEGEYPTCLQSQLSISPRWTWLGPRLTASQHPE